jgi:hypothetical protein
LEVNILEVAIFEVDILEVDILEVDIAIYVQRKESREYQKVTQSLFKALAACYT